MFRYRRDWRAHLDSNTLLKIIELQTEIATLGIDLAGVTATVVDRLPLLTSAEGAILEYAEEGEMVYRGVSGVAQPLLGLRVKREGSLSGLCVRQGEILRTDDTEIDPRVDNAPGRLIGLRSMLVAPLEHNDTVIGVLKIVSTRPHAFTDRDQHVLGMMTELIAAVMYNAARTQADQLYVRATTDSLTGVANRALFFDRLHQRTSNGRRHPMPFALLSIDMDGLKSINDHYGHRVGDAAIRETALRIGRIPRKEDTVARLGGDEFGVIIEHPSGRNDIPSIADRISHEVRQPFTFEGHAVPLSVSLGVAYYPEDGTTTETLIDAADQSMYAFKNSSRKPSIPAA
jgi:diguanylate cyclase (GGDEF)-like protein